MTGWASVAESIGAVERSAVGTDDFLETGLPFRLLILRLLVPELVVLSWVSGQISRFLSRLLEMGDT